MIMCDHSIVMKGMCCLCGQDLQENEKKSTTMIAQMAVQSTVVERSHPHHPHKRTFTTASASVAIVHNIPELVISHDRAAEMGKADIARLLQRRQLVLLVDLDQTLVHTTGDRIPADMKDVHHFQMNNGHYIVWYHTKLRPGTAKFLEDMSDRFELQIATFGSRMYAHKIAEYLDPGRKLFHPSRILSRDECLSPSTKIANMASLFPCGDSLVCIIDDRDEVWNFAANLIRVKPYFYFAGTGDINAPPGVPVIPRDHSSSNVMAEDPEDSSQNDGKRRKVEGDVGHQPVEDTDDYLLYLPEILTKIHDTFYEEYDKHKTDPENVPMPDVKKIIPTLKSQVLKDCRIVFSGVIPKNSPLTMSRPYIAAKEFGATIQDDVVTDPPEQHTTHVIAAYWNTAKIRAAQELTEKNPCHIVTLGWLWASTERWERVDERLFLLPEQVDSNSAVRDDARKRAKVDFVKGNKDSNVDKAGTSTAVEELDETPFTLSTDLIRSMNDEVAKALEEDGLSLGSCSSDEDSDAGGTAIAEPNSDEIADSESSKASTSSSSVEGNVETDSESTENSKSLLE